MIETGIPNSPRAAIENLEVRRSPNSQGDALDAKAREIGVSLRVSDQEHIPKTQGQQTNRQEARHP